MSHCRGRAGTTGGRGFQKPSLHSPEKGPTLEQAPGRTKIPNEPAPNTNHCGSMGVKAAMCRLCPAQPPPESPSLAGPKGPKRFLPQGLTVSRSGFRAHIISVVATHPSIVTRKLPVNVSKQAWPCADKTLFIKADESQIWPERLSFATPVVTSKSRGHGRSPSPTPGVGQTPGHPVWPGHPHPAWTESLVEKQHFWVASGPCDCEPKP